MARIRTIKPDTWTDRGLAECSRSARLLFVAALNFATDFGVLLDSPIELKMKCFPADNLEPGEIDGWVDELVDHGLWLRTEAPNGDDVIAIRSFSEHQRIDKKTPGKWGDPTQWEAHSRNSTTTPRALHEDSERSRRALTPGREGKGMEVTNPPNPPARGEEVGSLTEPCDRCGAKPEEPCTSRTGKPTKTHGARLREPNLGKPIPPLELPPTRHPRDCAGGCNGDNFITYDDGVLPCKGAPT